MHIALQLWSGKAILHRCKLKQMLYAIKMSAIFVIHQQVNKELHRFIAHDRSVYLASFAAQLNHADKSDIMKRLKPLRMGKRVRDLARKPLPIVCMEDGTVAQTADEAKARWRRHYAAMEGGTEVTPYELWQEDMWTRPSPPNSFDLKASDSDGVGETVTGITSIEGHGLRLHTSRAPSLQSTSPCTPHLAIVFQTNTACTGVPPAQRREAGVSL